MPAVAPVGLFRVAKLDAAKALGIKLSIHLGNYMASPLYRVLLGLDNSHGA